MSATSKAKLTPRKRLLLRNDPLTGRVDALHDLQNALALSCEIYQSHGDDGKRGAFVALMAVTDYLTNVGIPAATFTPLQDVLLALGEAEHGIGNRLFKPAPKGRGRRQKNLRDQNIVGILAAVAEFFWMHGKSAGWSLEQSLREAAKEISAAGRLPNVGWQQLKEHRNEVRQAQTGDVARDTYDIQVQSPILRQLPLFAGRLLAAHDLHVLAGKNRNK